MANGPRGSFWSRNAATSASGGGRENAVCKQSNSADCTRVPVGSANGGTDKLSRVGWVREQDPREPLAEDLGRLGLVRERLDDLELGPHARGLKDGEQLVDDLAAYAHVRDGHSAQERLQGALERAPKRSGGWVEGETNEADRERGDIGAAEQARAVADCLSVFSILGDLKADSRSTGEVLYNAEHATEALSPVVARDELTQRSGRGGVDVHLDREPRVRRVEDFGPDAEALELIKDVVRSEQR